MNSIKSRVSSRIAACACLLVSLACFTSSASAVPIEFANFNLLNANLPFTFSNNGGVSGTLQAVSVPVTFNFTSQSGLSTADHAALLSLNIAAAPIFNPASVLGGGFVQQTVPTVTTLSITEVGTGKNLLTMDFTGSIVGRSGGPNASLAGAQVNAQTVSYSSDFGSFGLTNNSYNLGLATITPDLSIGAGGFLSTFAANINGQFTAEFIPVPEPGSAALLGIAVVAGGALAVRRRQRTTSA